MLSEDILKRCIVFAKQIDGVDEQILYEGLRIVDLHRAVESAIDRIVKRWGLTPRQLNVIEVLYHKPGGGATPAELSDQVDLTRSAMTGALDSMERAGHIKRSPHPSDRRSVTISLTRTGRDFAKQCLTKHYELLSEGISTLTQVERRSEIGALSKALAHFSAVESREKDGQEK